MTLAIQAIGHPNFLDVVPFSGAQFPQDVAASLMDQVRSARMEVPFAKSMLDLLEVTARLSQLDELVVGAQDAAETETPETRKWKNISAMSAQFARSSLFDRQIAAIDELIDLSTRGGSLVKEASAQGEPRVEPSPQPALVSKPMVEASAPPPGLTAPVPLSKGASPPPPGLSAPPGLAAPPGLEHLAPAPKASAPTAVAPPWRRPPGVFHAPRQAPAGARSKKPWAKGAAQQPPAVGMQEEENRPWVFASTVTALNLEDYTDDSDDGA